MELKWLLSTGRIEAIQSGAVSVNPFRYNAFVETFGEGNVGLVSMDKVVEEIRTGKSAPVYSLKNNLQIERVPEKGVSSSLFLASGFDLGKGKITRREDLEEVMDYLEMQKTSGNIGTLVNSKYSTLFEDKKSFVGLVEKGMPVPRTYHFDYKDSFEDFIRENGKHVVKHRFGYDGVNNFLIDSSNLGLLEKEVISDYVVQELVPIVSETRIIFYGNEFLGARKIVDRVKPWENKKISKREHSVNIYFPTNEEIERAKSMFKCAGGLIGSIDTVQLTDGTEKILEFNGVATGLGYPGGIYDLNKIVAKRLKEDYVK